MSPMSFRSTPSRPLSHGCALRRNRSPRSSVSHGCGRGSSSRTSKWRRRKHLDFLSRVASLRAAPSAPPSRNGRLPPRQNGQLPRLQLCLRRRHRRSRAGRSASSRAARPLRARGRQVRRRPVRTRRIRRRSAERCGSSGSTAPEARRRGTHRVALARHRAPSAATRRPAARASSRLTDRAFLPCGGRWSGRGTSPGGRSRVSAALTDRTPSTQ